MNLKRRSRIKSKGKQTPISLSNQEAEHNWELLTQLGQIFDFVPLQNHSEQREKASYRVFSDA